MKQSPRFIDSPQFKAVACLLALTIAAALHPLPAAVAGLLFLYFIPGYLLIRFLRIQLDLLPLLAVSAVASIPLSTQLAYFLSLAFGYSRYTILASFALWVLLTPFTEFKQTPRKRTSEQLKQNLLPLAGAAIAFFAVFIVLNQTLWVPSPEGITVGGYNWADYFVHLSITESTNAGNFPPTTPYSAGTQLSYHWFVDFHTALFSKTAGLFSAPVVRLENAWFAFLLFIASYCLALSLCNNSKHSKTIAFFAALLIVFGGSLAWTQFFSDWNGGANAMQLLAATNYDGNSHSTQFPVMSTMTYLVVQRPQAVALPIFVAALFLAFEGLRREDNKKLLLAGILCALLAPFQYAAFVSLATAFLIMVAAKALEERRLRLNPSALLLLPVLAGAALVSQQAAAVGLSIKFELGWMAPKEPLAALLFYCLNFGAPALLALLAIFSVSKTELRDKKTLFALAAAFIIVPNIVTATAFQWDMSKFFSYAWIPLCVLAAAALARIHKLLWPLLIAVSIASSLFFLAWSMQSTWTALTPAEYGAMQWMSANLPQKAVVANYWEQNSPIEAAGRLRIAPPDWIGFSHLLPYSERQADVRIIYCGTPDESILALDKHASRFVFLGPEERNNLNCNFPIESDSRFTTVYDDQGIKILELKK